MPSMRPPIPAIATVMLAGSLGLAQSTIEWASPVDGEFGVATNWLPAVVPGELDTAVLGGVSAYTVVARDGGVGSLHLTNPDAVFQVRRRTSGLPFFSIRDALGPGVIQVNSGVPGEGARLVFLGMLDARVRLAGPGIFAAVIDARQPAVFGPSAVITGDGTIQGRWSGPALLHAAGPGALNLEGEFTGVTLRSSGGGIVNLSRVTLVGAILESTPESIYQSIEVAFVRDSIFRGEYHVREGNVLRLVGGNEFPDGFWVERAILSPEVDEVLDTTVRLNLGDVGMFPVTAAELGPSGLIAGTGTVKGVWNSSGTIAIEEPGTLELMGSFTGGTYRAAAGGTIESRGDFVDSLLVAGQGGTLDLSSASIDSSTIDFSDEGVFRSSTGTSLTNTTVIGDVFLRPGDGLTLGRGTVIDGGIRVNDGVTIGLESQLRLPRNNPIQIVVHLDGVTPGLAQLAAADPVGQAFVGEEGVVIGDGLFLDTWIVQGTLSPGDSAGAIGYLQARLDADLWFQETARLEIDVAGSGSGQFDRLGGPGSRIELDGTLRVRFADGYEPQAGDQYEIARATTLEGEFAAYDIQGPAGIGPAHALYSSDRVLLVACAADRDGDGALTVFDFLEFQNQFDAGDARADLDGDGRLTLFDFLGFQNRFDAGCD